ncbi:MAG TPA: ABC transporter substrate-binding protein [Desulfuromonadales bacterium]|nr:ABC transporter substrate-binding protein [Desulfuromonadales bacterium]
MAPPKTALLLTIVATALIVLLGAVRAMAAGEIKIAVFVSYDAPPMAEALAGFKESLARQGVSAVYELYPLQETSGQNRRRPAAVREDGTRLILALGSLALETAGREAAGIPVVAGMVLREADIRPGRGVTGVFLEFPIETQLAWLLHLMPDARRIGVVFNPAENRDTIEAAGKIAGRMGLELLAREVTTPLELPGALESLANRADVLWGISDNVVVTPQTARSLLLFSFRNRIPFIGLSTAWVKAGALYALDRDYRDIGRQCAELAAKVLAGAEAGSLAPVPPRRVTYSLNLKTAEQMKMHVPSSLSKAAEQLFQED